MRHGFSTRHTTMSSPPSRSHIPPEEHDDDLDSLHVPFIRKSIHSPVSKWALNAWRMLVLSGILVSIACLKGSRAAIDATIPALTSEKATLGMNNFRAAVMLAMGNASRVVGKLGWGFALDSSLASPKAWLLGAHLVMALLFFFFGSSHSYIALCFFWSLYMFIISLPWPTSTKVLHSWFSKEHYNVVMSAMSLDSRTSQFLVALIAASLLHAGISWRSIFHFYPVLMLLSFVYGVFTLKSSPKEIGAPPVEKEPTRVDNKTQMEALIMFVTSARFWTMNVSTGLASCLMELQSLIPLYFKNEKNLFAGNAVFAAVPFHLGAVLSLLFTKPYDWMNHTQRIIHLSVLNAVLVILFAVLSIWTHVHVALASCIFFSIGWAVSFIYYVPSNLFTLQYGGPHVAKLSTLQDAIQYSFVIVFDVLAGYLIKDEQWSKFFILCSSITVVSLISSVLFFIFESRAHEREKKEKQRAALVRDSEMPEGENNDERSSDDDVAEE